MVSRPTLSFDNSLDVLTFWFLNSNGTEVRLPKVAYNHFWGFMNFVDNKLPRVTKFFVNKSFNKQVVKKCSRIENFELAQYLKKSMACVNIVQL
jgi:hypothetical protein